MKSIITSVILLVLIILVSMSDVMAQDSLTVTAVEQVDLNRYCGTWYEIARLPNRFQRDCACCTSAEYSMLADGTIKVINRCRKSDGSLTTAEGMARKEKPDGPDAKLEVRFAPSWLGWLPFVWGTYWIIDLAPDYAYAVVGEPSREYLWILSRTPQMDISVRRGILARLRGMGYETDKLIFADSAIIGEDG